ncbi:DUF4062 domain-containing protein [Paenibacillus ferrarius]|uniref:DUF4062 domain-containing protein n=1 Tax=Paenibacillus ferrarius TaxID=1469647 RepID=UPI003D2A7635
MKKKYQIFVSSTFTDLVKDRQVAVEAILASGHIPAGMELFSAGNETQLSVIKRWIDESDIYLLILGGRYGSIEPQSGKSYTHLEYEYALEKNKPLFAIVISDELLGNRVKEYGQDIIELSNRDKYGEFKQLVLSKICRFFSDPKDIKIAIFETLNDFHQRLEMSGWISGKVIKTLDKYIEEITAKDEEIRKLKTELSKKSLLPNIDEEQLLFFKQKDINTRVQRILSSKYYGMIEQEEKISWNEGDIAFEMNFVSKEFSAYYVHVDEEEDDFNNIAFLFVDDGVTSINLNDLLYQIKLQIDEFPSNTDLEYVFILVTERINEQLEEKFKNAFNFVLEQCNPESEVRMEIWNKTELNKLEKELGLIFIEDVG